MPTRTAAVATTASHAAERPLPPPPSASDLTHVLPYLLRLALSETRMYWRLGLALVLMVCSKSAGLACPIFMKKAVNALSAGSADLALRCVILLGACSITNHLCKEAQYPTFTPLSQAVARRVAVNTFAHILGLDFSFHLGRRTGKLSRILERGTRSVQMLYRAVIFTFLPTIVELAFVCGLLAHTFNASVALVVGLTFTAYISWTLYVTQRATAVRKKVNEFDNKVTSKAVDALLNYETVTLFGNQQLEVAQYAGHLGAFQQAAQATERLSAMLNAGQAVILGLGMTAVLSAVVLSGTTSAGDIVMVNGLLLQLWAPLQFLGWFYRELRQSLVDMEEYFSILATTTRLSEGTRSLPPLLRPPSRPPTPSTSGKAAGGRSIGNGSRPGGGTPSANGSSAMASRTTTSGSSSSSSSSSTSTGMEDAHGAGHRQEEGAHSGRQAAWLSAAASGSGGEGISRRNQLPATSSGAGSGSSTSTSTSTSTSSVQNGAKGSGSLAGNGSSGGGRAMAGPEAAAPVGGLQLALRDVEFGYSSEREVLRGVSLSAGPGQSIALVGRSGSGKSTVLKLLARLYDVSSGQVLLNGVDVRELRHDALRGAVGVVPQDTVLFFDTILENIRYGRPDATDEECIAAAVEAQLDEAVRRMESGYATIVGERGLRLSGGEKQRVAIARAFLQRPRLLLCDEATSALDSTTESQIMSSLTKLAKGRTSVFVAHRLSTIRNCDKIIVLDAGRVVESGSHDALMKQGGIYREMWELQAAEDLQGPRLGARTSPPRQVGDHAGMEDAEDDQEAAVVVAALT